MILYLDTSSAVCKVWVDEKYSEYETGRNLARDLLGIVTECVGDMKELTGIAVMKGPGSFTGLRIGATVTNTMADYLGVPIVGESGEGWRERAEERLKRGENDKIVVPEYGAAPNVTKAKK